MRRIPLIVGTWCFLILTMSLPAAAGAAFACPKATSSSNGQFLVLTGVVVKPGTGNSAKVQSISFQVFPKEDFINAKHKLSTPATYWTNWARWMIVLSPEQLLREQGCPLPLISDDGEFLLLLEAYGGLTRTRPWSPETNLQEKYHSRFAS